jgi:glutaconyl-CoA/methylmalonyl-CoA decarboxylase subunit gamma
MKQYKFVINGNQYEVEIKDYSNDVAELEVNGTPFRVEVEHKMTMTKTPKISRPVTKAPAPAAPAAVGGAATPVLSPLPGTIMQVVVKPGDKVQKGDKLLIMEAMKMENNIQADREGTVRSVKVAVGDNVLQGAVLLEIE